MTGLPGEIPTLDSPVGSLEFRLRRDVDAFEVAGRRGAATGTARGIDTLRLGGRIVLRDLRVAVKAAGRAPAQTPAMLETPRVLETPLGVARHFADGRVERIVVSRDAPVAWVEWTPDGPAEGGAGEAGILELSWRVPVAASRPSQAVAWERVGRGLRVARARGGVALFVLSAEPETLDVAEECGELIVRARVALPGDQGLRGLRLAVVGAGPDHDLPRLLRIAGRPEVAVRAREGAANRVLADGLAVSSPDPDLDEGVARAVIRYDTARIASGPERGIEETAGEALARLAAGGFDAVHDYLRTLAGSIDADGRLLSPRDDDGAAIFPLLVARFLAWSGDINRTRGLWPAVERVAGAAAAGTAGATAAEEGTDAGFIGRAAPGLRATALAAVAVAAEEIGAGAVPAAAVEERGGGGDRRGASGEAGPVASGPVATLVFDVLRADPDAPRGRLVLRPRLPEEWDRLEVRRLAVGSAAIDVAYRHEAGVHRFRLEQIRGAAPLQLVLEPELVGEGVVRARVDGVPAELEPAPVDGRRRVPVQIVLDRPRTVEVEFEPDSL